MSRNVGNQLKSCAKQHLSRARALRQYVVIETGFVTYQLDCLIVGGTGE
jgi:hypothetical protein